MNDWPVDQDLDVKLRGLVDAEVAAADRRQITLRSRSARPTQWAGAGALLLILVVAAAALVWHAEVIPSIAGETPSPAASELASGEPHASPSPCGESPSASASTEASPSTEASASSEASASADASGSIEAATIDASASTAASTSSESSARNEAASIDASASSEPSASTEATASAEASPTPGCTPSTEASPSAELSPSSSVSPSPTPVPTPPATVKPAGKAGPIPNPKYKPSKKTACTPIHGSAVLLADGKALVWGDCDHSSDETMGMPLGWTEVFDPATNLFTPTGSSSIANPSAGGPGVQGLLLDSGQVLFNGEFYDPATGRYYPTGVAATLLAKLPDGRVMIAGDDTNSSPKIYDPATGKITTTGQMAAQAYMIAATMGDGRVLLIGTQENSKAAQVYDPSTNTYTATPSMAEDRGYGSCITTLHDGRLVVLGSGNSGVVEAYDPSTGTFSTVAPMAKPMGDTYCATLADGRVVVIGLVNGEEQPQYAAVPRSGASGGGLFDRRPARSASPFRDLMTGPYNYTGEIYDPANNTWKVIGHLNIQRSEPALVALSDGRAAVLGGYSDQAEIFDPKTNKFVVDK